MNIEKLMVALIQKIRESAPEYPPFKEPSTYEAALWWIKDNVGERFAENKPFWILIFDEFDQIVKINETPTTFFGDLQTLQENNRLSYIIGSRQNLEDLKLPMSLKPSRFFARFKKHPLSVWDSSTVKKFIREPYDEETKQFTDEDFDLIWRVTARHPFLLQVVCEQLVKAKESEREQFLASYAEEAQSIYALYWGDELSQSERELLLNLWLMPYSENTTNETLALIQEQKSQREKLERLGLIMVNPETGSLDLPRYLKSFLKREIIHLVKTNYPN